MDEAECVCMRVTSWWGRTEGMASKKSLGDLWLLGQEMRRLRAGGRECVLRISCQTCSVWPQSYNWWRDGNCEGQCCLHLCRCMRWHLDVFWRRYSRELWVDWVACHLAFWPCNSIVAFLTTKQCECSQKTWTFPVPWDPDSHMLPMTVWIVQIPRGPALLCSLLACAHLSSYFWPSCCFCYVENKQSCCLNTGHLVYVCALVKEGLRMLVDFRNLSCFCRTTFK